MGNFYYFGIWKNGSTQPWTRWVVEDVLTLPVSQAVFE